MLWRETELHIGHKEILGLINQAFFNLSDKYFLSLAISLYVVSEALFCSEAATWIN